MKQTTESCGKLNAIDLPFGMFWDRSAINHACHGDLGECCSGILWHLMALGEYHNKRKPSSKKSTSLMWVTCPIHLVWLMPVLLTGLMGMIRHYDKTIHKKTWDVSRAKIFHMSLSKSNPESTAVSSF